MPYSNLAARGKRRALMLTDESWIRRFWRRQFFAGIARRVVGPAFQETLLPALSFTDFGIPGNGEAGVSRVELRAILDETFRYRASSEAFLRPDEKFDDFSYYLPSRAEAEKVFSTRSAVRRARVDEILDCEDFAYWLRADFARNRYDDTRNVTEPFAAGILWGEAPAHVPHVVNVVVTSDAGVRAVLLIDSTPDNLGIRDNAYWSIVDYIVI